MTIQSLLNLMFEGSANDNVEGVLGSFNELSHSPQKVQDTMPASPSPSQ